MNQTVNQTLAALETAFAVRDIMIPSDALKRAQDYDSARAMLEDPECRYDVIPLPDSGPMTNYVTKGCERPKRIALPLLISDSTAIMDLLDILSERQPYTFVLSQNCICGYVHVSDLNNPLVKLPFYVLFEAVERTLWAITKSHLDDSSLEKVLDPQRYHDVLTRLARGRKNNVDRGFEGVLSFDEIVRVAQYFCLIEVDQADREAMAETRNRVFHSDKQLVPELKDLKMLVRARDTCKRLIQEVSAQ